MQLKNITRLKAKKAYSHSHTERLMLLLHTNMDSARNQVKRSTQIVAHSRLLIARVRLSLARARRNHTEMSGPGNPWIQ